jgi:threonine dehydrogenase-like Zn-dependent dehydrogenase
VSSSEARAYYTVANGRGEIRRERLPEPSVGQVRVEAMHSGISRGSELLVHRGLVPASEYQRMRAPHQAGDFPWPVKYGYCSVGRVSAGPPELLGREVFCLHPHQTAYVVDATAVIPLPDAVPAARAILAANMETALNGVWDSGLKAGDRVAVVGAGVVGLLVAYLAARHPGTQVQVVDIDAGKAEVVRAMGAEYASVESARGGADLVVHASGSPVGLQTALALAGMESTVVDLSWYGSQRASLALGEAFHAQRLSLKSSQVGSLPPSQRPRWNHRRRLALALELLRDDRLECLIDAHGSFESLPETMTRLAAGEGSALCYRVDYTPGDQPPTGGA